MTTLYMFLGIAVGAMAAASYFVVIDGHYLHKWRYEGVEKDRDLYRKAQRAKRRLGL